MRKKAKYIVGGLVALVILCGSIPLVNVTHKYNAGIVKAAVNGNKETIGKSIDEVQKAGWDVGVAWQDGRMFLHPCAIRMNLALPFSRVQEAFDRLDKYVFNTEK